MRLSVWVPVILVVLLLGALAVGLTRPKDDTVRSNWVGKPMPAIALDPATAGVAGISAELFRDGRPRLVNIFASWCVPCRAEAPQLARLAQQGIVIDGVALRDRPEDVRAFLNEYGNPYAHVGADPASRLALAIGSSGVPETFVIDGKGIVRAQYQGALTDWQVAGIAATMAKMR